jgi:hypothetical protein
MPALRDATAFQPRLNALVHRRRLAASIAPDDDVLGAPRPHPGATRANAPRSPSRGAAHGAGNPDFTASAWDNLTRRARDGTPAAAFRPTDGSSGSVPVLSTGEWIFSLPPGDKIAAPVLLPVGARILSIVWSFNKGGSSSALSMMLKKRTGSTITIVRTTSDSSSGSTWTTATASSINYTMESGYQVWLEVACGSTMHRFAWANIVYDE